MADTFPMRKARKLCFLRFHDETTSAEDAIIGFDHFKELGLEKGALVEVAPVQRQLTASAVKDFQTNRRVTEPADPIGDQQVQSEGDILLQKDRTNASAETAIDETGASVRIVNDRTSKGSYVFIAKQLPSGSKVRSNDVQLSISQAIATAFGFRRGMLVAVSIAEEHLHSASHVEIGFKDVYLARSDMWRMVVSELNHRTVYRGQKLLFLGSIKATVNCVWVDGKQKRSAFFTNTTRPIFRSESAKFIIFIEMSKEMWEFDSAGSGEVMFNKVINGFLPELFKNWQTTNARHLVSIILFTRLEYDNEPYWTSASKVGQISEAAAIDPPRDFYRVVVTEMASGDWIQILDRLKKEFRTFLKDITVQHVSALRSTRRILDDSSNDGKLLEYVIVGKPTTAARSNILEAINLASSQFSRDYIDRDLVRTGISVVVITAGSAVHEVDYAMLKLTTDTLMGNGIGIDLVCLSPMPLHSVPLFKYRNPQILDPTDDMSPVAASLDSNDNTPRPFRVGSLASMRSNSVTNKQLSVSDSGLVSDDWSYAMPHWIDVSFWHSSANDQNISQGRLGRRSRSTMHARSGRFESRCRMYELQMMSVMENEMTNIILPHLHRSPLHPWHRIRPHITGKPISGKDKSRLLNLDREWMDCYDDNIFSSLPRRRDIEDKARQKNKKSTDVGRGKSAKNNTEPQSNAVVAAPQTPSGYLDWKIKEKIASEHRTVVKKPSTVGFASSEERSVSRIPLLPRQISFSSTGLGTAKPTVSTNVSVTPVAARSLRSPTTHVPEMEADNFTTQFRVALTRGLSVPPAERLFKAALRDETGEPTKPIAITAARNITEHTSKPDDEHEIGSAVTVKELQRVSSRQRISEQLSPTGAFAFAASRPRLGSKLDIISSSLKNSSARHISPNSAISPWLTLVNPCNPTKNDLNRTSQYRRWHHVFPHQLRTSSMKWKSLCSPASVPLTNDFFPSTEQLRNEYHESPYTINPNSDDELREVPASREQLLRELIAFRLAHGFQFVVGNQLREHLGFLANNQIQIFGEGRIADDGASIFMTVGGTIHQLTCTAEGGIEIKRYNRKPSAAAIIASGPNAAVYKPYVRTLLENDYVQRNVTFSTPRSEYNWNVIDNFLAGHQSDFSENLRFWRARFVLIPVDLPAQKGRALTMLTEDSAEEIRLEGIKKLAQIWQRHRVLPPEERNYQSKYKRKDPNPLAIDYQTRDPSAVIAAGLHNTLLNETEPSASINIFGESETYATKSIDIQKLAQDLQGERGIKMLDRRWHLRLHYNCFLGLDLTTWLLEKFRDIHTREDAVNLGNELMQQGLFQHVQGRHNFRDGQFFYQIASEHRLQRPESRLGWFGSRRGERSVPSTPMSEGPRHVSSDNVSRRPDTSSSSDADSENVLRTPVQKPADARPTVNLSHVMRYDVDFRHKSYRPEIINLHYDRLHNPDNCYHVRIDWMNVTAKLIDDAVASWAATIERYGLKLVEVPIAEARAVPDVHPFRRPYLVRLALSPPAAVGSQYFDNNAFGPYSQVDRFMYHKAILRRLNFVLDIEAASSFPTDVDVMYSWGRPDYKLTQYIHKSGMVFAQITEEGNFLLLANRLANSRTHLARGIDIVKGDPNYEPLDRRPMTASRRSPMSSPVTRPYVPTEPAGQAAGPSPQITQPNPEEIKDIVEAFCSDVTALKALYEETTESRKPSAASPSPRVGPVSASQIGLELSIPSIRLPPRLIGNTVGGNGHMRAISSPLAARRMISHDSASSGTSSRLTEEEKED